MRRRFSQVLYVTTALGLCLFITAAGQANEWISLFDGQSLAGWKASEHPDSFRVADGQIVCDGPRAHLFYVGDVEGADFTNFEIQASVMTRPGANSGIYFHTEYQETGYPTKGYEVQVNNTYTGHGKYYEYKKTGSLYGVRNQYKSIVADNQWFTLRILVEGKRVRVFVNDQPTADYVEPPAPVRGEQRRDRRLSHGTFALQCHDEGSKVMFRDIRVRPLPEARAGRGAAGRRCNVRRDREPPGEELPAGRLPRPPQGRPDPRRGAGQLAGDGHQLRHRRQLRAGLPRHRRRRHRSSSSARSKEGRPSSACRPKAASGRRSFPRRPSRNSTTSSPTP